MGEDVYRKMQRQLDQYSVGFPATESGIELKILKYLLTEDEAEMFTSLSPLLETAAAAAARLDRPADEVSAKLEAMADKGLVFRLEKGGEVKFGAIPFVHGLFEFQVKDLKPELAAMVGRYFLEGFEASIRENAGLFLRTVPVRRSIDPGHNVAAFEDAVELLKSKDTIVVADCICRKSAGMFRDNCGKRLEACFMFGSMGEYYIKRDMGRKIDAEEAIAILTECQEAGLVTQPATARNPAGMCNCCGDCCGVLSTLNNHPKPATVVFSNYQAKVDADECNGCGDCLDRCQMRAVAIGPEGVCEVDLDRCIGCGLCVTTCSTGAMRLVSKEGEQKVPPATSMEQMIQMAKKRGVI